MSYKYFIIELYTLPEALLYSYENVHYTVKMKSSAVRLQSTCYLLNVNTS